MGNFRNDGEVKRRGMGMLICKTSASGVCVLQSPSPFFRSVMNVCVGVQWGVSAV